METHENTLHHSTRTLMHWPWLKWSPGDKRVPVYRKQNRIIFDASLGNQRGIFLPQSGYTEHWKNQNEPYVWVTATFRASLYSANLPAIYAFYRVSVRRATISLSLLLACTSRYKPWEPLTNSLVTTPMWTFTTEYGHARHTEERFQGYPWRRSFLGDFFHSPYFYEFVTWLCGKGLASVDELAVLDGGKCILQLRGVRPFKSDKYDLTQHPNYKLTAGADKKNTFSIEAFLDHRLKLKPGDKYEVVDADHAK